MADYAAVSDLDTTLVRKALRGSLFTAPYAATALTASNLFVTGGGLATLPSGYRDGGITTDEGIRTARAVESEDITGWQFLEPVRSDPTSDSETLQVDFLETNRTTIELYTGNDLTGVTQTNGAITIDKPALPEGRYLRMLALAVDSINGKEFYIGRYYPRAKVTGWADQAFSKGGALQWGMTFTTYNDPILGVAKRDFLGGPGFKDIAAAMGFTITFPA